MPVPTPASIYVSTEADLIAAVEAYNSGAATNTTIIFNNDITLTQELPLIAPNATGGSLTIDGGGHTLSGGGVYRGLWVQSGVATIETISLDNMVAQGGDGGNGFAAGGGGAGLGGGLFVGAAATVTIANVNFADDSAIGGDAGVAVPPGIGATPGGGGGGGGLGGDGGNSNAGGGGGGGGIGGRGGDGSFTAAANNGGTGFDVGGAAAGDGGGLSQSLVFSTFLFYSKVDQSEPGGGGGSAGGGGGGGIRSLPFNGNGQAIDAGGGGGGAGGKTAGDWDGGTIQGGSLLQQEFDVLPGGLGDTFYNLFDNIWFAYSAVGFLYTGLPSLVSLIGTAAKAFVTFVGDALGITETVVSAASAFTSYVSNLFSATKEVAETEGQLASDVSRLVSEGTEKLSNAELEEAGLLPQLSKWQSLKTFNAALESSTGRGILGWISWNYKAVKYGGDVYNILKGDLSGSGSVANLEKNLGQLQAKSLDLATLATPGSDAVAAAGNGGYGGGGGGGGGDGGDGGFGGGGGGGGQPFYKNPGATVSPGDSQTQRDEELGAQYFSGGSGGFGGGGGGGGMDGAGQDGGFGGGAGGDGEAIVDGVAVPFPGMGGGGLGAGGAIFVQSATPGVNGSGGILTIDGNITFTNLSAQGGAGFDDGLGLGAGIFLQGSEVLHIDAPSGSIVAIGSIADQAGSVAGYDSDAGGVDVTGPGLVQLSGNNTFQGNLIIGEPSLGHGVVASSGNLELMDGSGLNPLATVVGYDGGSLQVDAGAYFANVIDLGNLKPGDSFNVFVQPGAQFQGVFENVPSNFDMSGVSWTQDYMSILTANGPKVALLTPVYGGAGTQVTILNNPEIAMPVRTAADITTALDYETANDPYRSALSYSLILTQPSLLGDSDTSIGSAVLPTLYPQGVRLTTPDNWAIAGTLAANAALNTVVTTTLSGQDVDGVAYSLNLQFQKTGTNVWQLSVDNVTGGLSQNPVLLTQQSITFTSPDFSLATTQPIAVLIPNGSTIDLTLTGLAQSTSIAGTASTLNGTHAATDGEIGRGSILLPPGSGALLLGGLNDTGTLQIDSNLFSSVQSWELSGSLSAGAAVVANPAGTNQAGSESTIKTTLSGIDGLGNTYSLDIYLTKTAADNTWQLAVFDAATASASGGFPYSSPPLSSEVLTFPGAPGSSPLGGSPSFTLADGATIILYTNQLVLSATAAATASTLTAAAASIAPLDVYTEGTVVLAGDDSFTQGIQIASGTLDLAASSSVDLNGAAPQRFTLNTHDTAGDPLTLDIYLTKVTSMSYEVTAYDAADESSDGGFPYTAGPLGTATVTLDSSGQIVGTSLLKLMPHAGDQMYFDLATTGIFATTAAAAVPADVATDYSTATTVQLLGNLPSLAPAASGPLPSANNTTVTYTEKTTLSWVLNGSIVTLDVFFTKTAADTWNVTVYNAADRTSNGGFPYLHSDLASATLTFVNGVADALNGSTSNLSVTVPLPGAQTLQLALGGLAEGPSSYSLVPLSGAFTFEPYSAPGDDLGALPSENIGGGAAAGSGPIIFAPENGAQAILRVEAGTPSNLIEDFTYGDHIELASIPTSGVYQSDADGTLTIPVGGGSVSLNFDPATVAPESVFALSAMSGGGVDVTLLQSQFTVGSQAALTSAFNHIVQDSQIGPVASEVMFEVDASPGFTFGAATVSAPGSSIIDIRGALFASGGGLTVAAGTVGLENVSYGTTAGSSQLMTVDSGAMAIVGSGAVLSGGITVASSGEAVVAGGSVSGTTTLIAGGELLLLDGTVSGAIAAPSAKVVVAPEYGQTVNLNAQVSGSMTMGTSTQPSAGRTVLGSSATISGSVMLNGPGVLEAQAGATVGASVTFNDDPGATLQLDAATLPANTTIDWGSAGEVDLAAIAPAGSAAEVLTVGAAGALTVSGGQVLQTDLASGTAIIASGDLSGGTLLTLQNESVAVTTENEFDVAAIAFDLRPVSAGIVDTIDISDAGPTLQLGAESQYLPAIAPAGDTLRITGSAGIDVASGDMIMLGGDNSYTGGLTIEAGTLVDLATSTAAGSGPITFNGTGSLLEIDATALSNTITGIVPGDMIDIATAPWSANSPTVLSTDIYQDLSVPTASGTLSLNFSDLAPGTGFSAVSDGSGGTVLMPLWSQNAPIVVSNAAQLAQAITVADSLAGTGESITIQFAPNAVMSLSSELPAIDLQPGVTLNIDGEGGTINGNYLVRDLLVTTGNVNLDNLTLENGQAVGGAGGSGFAGGGGGAGLGGDLFVGAGATVTLSNTSLANGAAIGGAGGASGGVNTTAGSAAGGGGGLGGAGGNGEIGANYAVPGDASGGGGGIGLGASGGSGVTTSSNSRTVSTSNVSYAGSSVDYGDDTFTVAAGLSLVQGQFLAVSGVETVTALNEGSSYTFPVDLEFTGTVDSYQGTTLVIDADQIADDGFADVGDFGTPGGPQVTSQNWTISWGSRSYNPGSTGDVFDAGPGGTTDFNENDLGQLYGAGALYLTIGNGDGGAEAGGGGAGGGASGGGIGGQSGMVEADNAEIFGNTQFPAWITDDAGVLTFLQAGDGGFGGGGGGINWVSQSSQVGGAGGFGGGGGGGPLGGDGGFGGGGGGGGYEQPAYTVPVYITSGGPYPWDGPILVQILGGQGGWGAGAGGDDEATGGAGGGGGGGLGAGGDVFVAQGGNLIFAGNTDETGGTAQGGQGAGNFTTVYQNGTPINHNGLAVGAGLFAQGNNTIIFAPPTGQTVTVSDVITDQSAAGSLQFGSTDATDTAGEFTFGATILNFANPGTGSLGVTVNGPGAVKLTAADNYTGVTTISSGTLEIDPALLTGPIVDTGALILEDAAPVVATSTATTMIPGQTLTLALDIYGYGYPIVEDQTTIPGSGLMSDLAAALQSNIDAYPPFSVTYDAGSNSITLQNLSSQTDLNWLHTSDLLQAEIANGQISDGAVALLENSPFFAGLSFQQNGSTIVITSAAPQLSATEAISIDGISVAVGGNGTMNDLVQSINAANVPGIVAAIDQATGQLYLTSTNGPVSLADVNGDGIVEALGLSTNVSGLQKVYTGTLSGSGSVEIAYRGTTLNLTSATSLSGTMTIDATNTLDAWAEGSTFGTVNGAGAFNARGNAASFVSIDLGGPVLLTGNDDSVTGTTTVQTSLTAYGSFDSFNTIAGSGSVALFGGNDTVGAFSGTGALAIYGSSDSFGSVFANANGVVFASGGSDVVTGPLTGSGIISITNGTTLTLSGQTGSFSGGIDVNGGTLILTGSAGASGIAGGINVSGGGTLALQTATDVPVTLGSNAGIVVANGDAPTDLISGFTAADTIDLLGLGKPTTGLPTYNAATDTLTVTGSKGTAVLHIAPFADPTWRFTAVGDAGGTGILIGVQTGVVTSYTALSASLDGALNQINIGNLQSEANTAYTIVASNASVTSMPIDLASGDTVLLTGSLSPSTGGPGLTIAAGAVTLSNAEYGSTDANSTQLLNGIDVKAGASLSLNNTSIWVDGPAAIGAAIELEGTQTLKLSTSQGYFEDIIGAISDDVGAGRGSGIGHLVVTGAGILRLDAANSFTGGISLNGGTLVLNATGAGGSGAINVNGGTLKLAAAASAAAVTVTSGTLEIAAAGAVTGAVTLNGGTLQLDGISSGYNGTIKFTGPNETLALAPGATGFVAPTQILNGFGADDRIVLKGSQYAYDALNFNVTTGALSLVNASGGADLTFQLANPTGYSGYFEKQVANGQTTISFQPFNVGSGTNFNAPEYDSVHGYYTDDVPENQIQFPSGANIAGGDNIGYFSPVSIDFAPAAGTTQVISGQFQGASLYTLSGPGTVDIGNVPEALGSSSVVELDGGTLELAQGSVLTIPYGGNATIPYGIVFGGSATLQFDSSPGFSAEELTNFGVGDRLALVGFGTPGSMIYSTQYGSPQLDLYDGQGVLEAEFLFGNTLPAGYGYVANAGTTSAGQSALVITLAKIDALITTASGLAAAIAALGNTTAASGALDIAFGANIGGFPDPIALGAVALGSAAVMTVDGAGYTLDGTLGVQGFVVNSGNVTLKNLSIVNDTSVSGLGGAVSIGSGANVVLDDVTISGGEGTPGKGGTAVNVAGGGMLTLAADSNTTAKLYDAIGGPGTIVVNAAGEVDLDAPNVFTGGLTLQSGTLVLGSALAAGGGAVTIDGGAASVTAGHAFDFASSLTILGGYLDAVAANALNAALPITISAGAMEISAAAAANLGNINVTGSGTLILDAGAADPGTVTLSGNGKLVLNQGATVGAVSGLSTTTAIDFAGVEPGALSLSYAGTNLVVDGTELLGVQCALQGYSNIGTEVSAIVTQFNVANETQLGDALNVIYGNGASDSAIGGAPSYVINLTSNINFSAVGANSLPEVELRGATLTVNGNGYTLDGGGVANGFVISDGAATIENVSLVNLAFLADYGYYPAPSTPFSALNAVNARVALNNVSIADASSVTSGSDVVLNYGSLIVDSASLGTIGAMTPIAVANTPSSIVLAPAAGDVVTVPFAIPLAPSVGNGVVDLTVANSFGGTTQVAGTLELSLNGAAGRSTIALNAGAILKLDAAATQNNAQLDNVVTGLAAGGAIDFLGIANATASLNGQTLIVSNGTTTFSVQLGDANLDPADLIFQSDGGSGTTVSYGSRPIGTVTVPTTVNFGAIQLGTTASQSVVVSTPNTGASNQTISATVANITSGFSETPPGVVLQPIISPSTGTFTISATPTTDGVTSGTITVDLTASEPTRLQSVSSQSITLTVAAYSLANSAGFQQTPYDLGAIRVGTTASQSISFANGSGADPYQEELIVSAATTPADFLVGPTAAARSGSSGQLSVTFDPIAAGTFSENVALDQISQAVTSGGSVISGLSADLGGRTITLAGTAYNTAVPELTSSLNFGVAHVGDVVASAINVSNMAAAGLSDVLNGGFAASLPAGFTGSGALNVSAGTSASLTISLDTSQAGVSGGTAYIALNSHDGVLADQNLGSAAVALSAVVDNYASAALQQTSGGGTWTSSGNVYTLDLGTIAGGTSVGFAVDNTATGQADTLGGSFQLSGGTPFVNTGFGSFSGLSAAGVRSGFQVAIVPTANGTFSETITLSPYGANSGGYHGALSPLTLTISATVAISSFSAGSEAALNADIADISSGGINAAANTAYVINLTSGITLGAPLTSINLLSGSILTLSGGSGIAIDGQDSQGGLVVSGGSLQIEGVSVRNLSGGAAISVLDGEPLVLMADAGQTETISGSISTSAGLSVNGSGTVDLAASGGYSGSTVVAGNLVLGATGGAGTGGIDLEPGSTLAISSGVTVANLISGFADGASIDVDGVANADATLVGDLLTLSGGGSSVQLMLADSDLSAYGLHLAPDTQGGTIVTYSAPALQAPAIPSLPSSVDLGAFHVGDVASGSFTASNAALQGAETLFVYPIAIQSGPFSIAGAGTISLAPGSGGMLSVAANTSYDGYFAGAELFHLYSGDPNLPGQGPASATVNLSATVYAYGSPVFDGGSVISLGSTRVGAAALTGRATLEDGLSYDPYLEALTYQLTSATNGLTVSGTSSGTLAAGDRTPFDLSLSTASAGALNDTVTFSDTSEATSGTGLSNTTLGGFTLNVAGQVYAPAVASLPSTIVNLGIVHVGDAATQNLTISNSAVGALTDALIGGFASVSPNFVGTGALNVAAGSSGTLSVALNTGSAGTFTGSATLALSSHDAALSDISVSAPTVNLAATINNYAAFGIEVTSGFGLLTGSGSVYTLNLGPIYAGDATKLNIFNAATGPADDLGATFAVSGSDDFINSGLTSFSGADARQTGATPTITIAGGQGGAVSETITIQGTDSNSGGYSAAMPSVTLTVDAEVVGGAFPAFTVTNEADLNAALAAISQGGADAGTNTSYTIVLAPASNNTIVLTSDLATVTLLSGSTLLVKGNGAVIDGDNSWHGFAIAHGAVTLQNVTMANAVDAAILQGTTNLTLAPTANQMLTISSPVADTNGSTTLTIAGPGEVVFAGGASYAGTVAIAGGGTFALDSDPTQTTGAIVDGGTLTFGTAASGPLTNSISGSGNVSVGNLSGRSVTLDGALDWSGTTTVAAGGTVVFDSDTSHLSGAVTNAGTIEFDGSASTTLGAAVAGGGTLEFAGSQIVSLTASNSFTGGMQIVNGGVALETAGAAGTGAIRFGSGSSATLYIGAGDTPSNLIAGLASGDAIDLAGFDLNSTTAVLDGTNVLAVTDGTHSANLSLDAGAQGYEFQAASSGDGVLLRPTAFAVSIPNETITVTATTSVFRGDVLIASGISNPGNISLAVAGVVSGGTAVPVGTAIDGTYGTLTASSDGTYTYQPLFTAQEQVNYSATTETTPLHDTFAFTVASSGSAVRTANLTVTVARPLTITTDTNTLSGTDESSFAPFTNTIVEYLQNESVDFDVNVVVSFPDGTINGALTPASLLEAGFTDGENVAWEYGYPAFVYYLGAPGIGATPDQIGQALHRLEFVADAHIAPPGTSYSADLELFVEGQNQILAPTYTVTMTAADAGPTAAPIGVSVSEGATVSGTLQAGITDPDSYSAYDPANYGFGIAAGTATPAPINGAPEIIQGQYGQLQIFSAPYAGYPAYYYHETAASLVDGQSYTDTFTYSVADSAGKTSSSTLAFTTIGPSSSPANQYSQITGGAYYDALRIGPSDVGIGGPAGDIIMPEGRGAILEAGSGPDIFAISPQIYSNNSGPVTIQGFRTGVDKIDISSLAPLYAPNSDLQVYLSLDGSGGVIIGSNSGIMPEIEVQGFVAPSDIITGVGETAFEYVGTGPELSQYLDTFNAISSQITSLVSQGGGAVTFDVAQLTSDASALALLPVGTAELADTAANLSAAMSSLINNYTFGGMNVSDNGASEGGFVDMTMLQYLSVAAEPFVVSIFNRFAYADGQTPSQFIAIDDTAANIAASLSNLPYYLQYDDVVGKIIVSDNEPVLLSLSDYLVLHYTDPGLLSELQNADGSAAIVAITPTVELAANIGFGQAQVTSTGSLQGGGAPGATVNFAIDGVLLSATATANAGGSWSFTPASLSMGAHQVLVTETSSGITTSATLDFEYDPNAPTLSLAAQLFGFGGFTETNEPTQIVSGHLTPGSAGSSILIYDGGAVVGSTTADATGNWATLVTLTSVTSNFSLNAVTAVVTDALGNQIESPTDYFTYYVGATIASGTTLVSGSGVDFDVVTGSGTLMVQSGGTVSGALIETGGLEIVGAGGAASATVVATGGTVYVLSGGTASGTTLKGSGWDFVIGGGSDFGARISGVQFTFGYAGDALVSNGGAEGLFGSGSGMTVQSGGYGCVESGGTAISTTVSGILGVVGSAVSTTVNSGGMVAVHGTTTGTIISNGGVDYVESGAVESAATISNGGVDEVMSGGSASGTILSNGGIDFVLSGGTASGTVIDSGGWAYVLPNGSDCGTQVSGGGVDFVFGYAVSTVVSSGGALGLFGSASGMTLSSGAYACVEAGGTATSTSVDGILGVVGSSLNATVSYGGEITVHGGASGTTADSGGFEYVADGGTESGATISGGALEVGSGGTLDSAAFASSGALGGFLLLDDSTQFHGLVAGFGSGADIALLDIGYASGITTFAWSQTTGGLNGSGTLAVTDGTHNANIILLGNYVAGRFALDSYNGGTLVTDPPLQASPAMLAHA